MGKAFYFQIRRCREHYPGTNKCFERFIALNLRWRGKVPCFGAYSLGQIRGNGDGGPTLRVIRRIHITMSMWQELATHL